MADKSSTESGTAGAGKRGRRSWAMVLFVIACIVLALLLTFIIARGVFHLTSANAVLYTLRQADGTIEVTNHLRPDETDRVERMMDFSCLFNAFSRTQAAIGLGNIEYTWDEKNGDGVIKDFRPDGTELLVVLARFATVEGSARGLFIGGDLPLGDTQRSLESGNNNTGIAFYDGKRWNHIWCTINESVALSGGRKVPFDPSDWKYLGSKALKSSTSEVILESSHELNTTIRGSVPVSLFMKRTMQKRTGEDYLLLKVEFMNQGSTPFAYAYSIGDEPWVGDFYRGSRGNVGWTDGALYKYEGFVDPGQHTFAGFWDIGNDVIKEQGEFTGYADFIEWLSGPPTFVYFANDFDYSKVDTKKALSSWNFRVVNLIWLNQALQPGERKEYVVALGMAKPGRKAGVHFPVKPVVRRNIDRKAE
jgi:hypothetical protein